MSETGPDQVHVTQGGQVYPMCHQTDHVRKVSAITAAGTSTTTLEGPTGSSGYIYDPLHPLKTGIATQNAGYTKLTGGSQTLQSEMLSSPPEPIYHSPWGIWSILVVILFAFMTIVGLSSGSISTAFITLLLGALIAVPKFIRAPKERAKADAQHTRWQEAMSRWDRLCDLTKALSNF